MPYETVKIVQKFQSYVPSYGFQLEDDDIWKRFCIFYGSKNDVWILATVANILEKDGRISRVVYKDYKFPLLLRGYEPRTLHLTDEFLTAYPVNEGTPIHVFLNTLVREKETIKIPIFDEIERGTMDVEPKDEFGEVILNDSLIICKPTDEYYIHLVSEINRAFNYKLPNATLVMLRKLFENLIVDLLKARYRNEIDLYYSKESHRHLSLNYLIPNLDKKFGELTINDETFFREKNDFFRFLHSIRQYGDASAHVLASLEKNMDKISPLKPSINEYINRVIQLTRQVQL